MVDNSNASSSSSAGDVITTSNLLLYYQNCRGLNTKTDILYASTSECVYDFVGLTETWLSDGVSSSELFSDDYNVLRSDRKFGVVGATRGGGVALAVKTKFPTLKIDFSLIEKQLPLVDIVGAKLHCKPHNLCVIVVYLPPQLTNVDFEYFVELFVSYEFLQQSDVVIVGDFNVPNLNKPGINDSKSRSLHIMLNTLDMRQLNDIVNNLNCTLDLVISNLRCDIVRDYTSLVPPDNYHPPLCVEIWTDNFRYENFSYSSNDRNYNFRKANFPLLRQKLSEIDWSFLNAYTDVNDAVSHFYDVLYNAFDQSVPTFKSTRKRRYPFWYNHDLITILRKKNKLLKLYRSYRTGFYSEKLTYLCEKIKIMKKEAYITYIMSIQNNVSKNPKQFWQYIQSRRGFSRIPATMKYNGVDMDVPTDIVNAFATYFSSVYIDSNVASTIFLSKNPTYQCINLRHICSEEVRLAIKSLKDKFTAGVDMVPSFVVKDCACVFKEPLCILFNLILKTSVYPTLWKTSRICPVFKSGERSVVENYRPISIICNFSKVFEIILYNYIYNNIKPYLSPSQHGFVQGRSTVTNLACFTQFVAETLDSRGQVDVIYTDFRKAFDQIDHYILLSKLNQMGISDGLLQVLQNYLLNRTLVVQYGGFTSSSFIPTSGVPQGSNLGPLLFLIFINDLPSVTDVRMLMFADDVKMYSSVITIDDCHYLQQQIDNISTWCDRNRLALNVSKCKAATFSHKHASIIYNYNINNNELVRCSAVKDLGITFDNTLSFNLHIESVVASASKALGFIVRNSKNFTSILCIKSLYYAFVRSKLEYASLIFGPLYNNQIQSLEGVQRRFLKFLYFKSEGIYPERGIDQDFLLQMFKMGALYKRRIAVSLTFLHGLLHNHIDCCELIGKLNFRVPRLEARCEHTFYVPIGRTNTMLKSPLYVICSNFNSINDLKCDINFISLRSLLKCV